jgi:maleylpyruvate isomerase
MTDLDRLDDLVAGCAASHQALLSWLDDQTAVDVSAPSALPDWTVGHVLTHIARNADGVRAMLEGARDGEERAMYPGGVPQRNADIESGAPRPFAEQVRDIRSACWAVESVWAQLDHEAWMRNGLFIFGAIPAWSLPRRRWREVEIHWSDLGLSHTWQNWSAEFVRLNLAERRTEVSIEVPAVVAVRGETAELAWLFSRDIGGDAPPPPPFA